GEEYAVPTRDTHDRFQWEYSSLSKSYRGPRPLVSEYSHLLLDCFLECSKHTKQPMIRKEFWPNGKPMAGCLTHDVDVVKRGKLGHGVAVRDVKGALSSLMTGRLGRAAGQISTIATTATSSKDPYWTFDRIAAMEGAHDFRSTYYFMADNRHPEDAVYTLADPSISDLMAKLEGSGCEIGLHGSYASYTDAEMLSSLKTELEQKLGHAVIGHRNHFLRFRVPDSWKAQEAAGFTYDATLGFADHEGFRGGHAFPFVAYDLAADRPMRLVEVPLAVMEVSLSKYRKLRGEDAAGAIQTVLRQATAVGGLATLLWHNDSFFDPESPGVGALYERSLDWLAEENAHVAPVQEIVAWWKSREAVRLIPLEDGRNGWRMEAPEEIDGLVLRIGLPDAGSSLRVHGQVPLALRRDGPDHLLEYGPLPAGFSMDIEYR
ncbi:MAG TPA: polysaccharide deacetylase family protein, partial [Chloroflexota bacterium]|nr:polysaccharide deacetylase family protein [Chloroflexota bacterium]